MGELYERAWPVQDAKGAVVIVHGLGEHSGRYAHVAAALNQAGYSVYAQDVRGHGQSVGSPGDMGGDVDRIVGDAVDHCVRVRAGHDKVFLLGHSMGSLIALASIPRLPNGTLSGLVLSGTALEPGPAAVSLMTEGAVSPETLSTDPAVQQAYVDDPLVWDKVPGEVLAASMELTDKARSAVSSISAPFLLLHGVDDELTSITGANYVHVQSVVNDKTLQGYQRMRHEVFNETEKDAVFADLVRWLDAH